MRILFLLNRYPGIGGIENITSFLSRLFKSELGHHISIFSVVSLKSKSFSVSEGTEV